MPTSARARNAPPAGESSLSETPEGRLQELELRQLIGYQLAQANIVTLAAFDAVVGKPLGLRTVEYTVLALVRANGNVSPAQLAKALNLSPSYMTLALDKLEARGLVLRQANERDRRGQRLQLTPEGRALAIRTTQELLEAERRSFATLTTAEQLMLAELLHKLACSRGNGPAQ